MVRLAMDTGRENPGIYQRDGGSRPGDSQLSAPERRRRVEGRRKFVLTGRHAPTAGRGLGSSVRLSDAGGA
ncbi:MAG: hypothetical protein L0Z68_04385 [Gammaproteobacteria bacterium]|nr:hypothetical protein [Gammaproteobacteria bacterium]